MRRLLDLLGTMPEHPTRRQRLVVSGLLLVGMLLLAMVPDR